MKRINKKIIAIIAITTILILAASGAVFAYLNSLSSQAVTATTNITSDKVIEIASFDDLVNYSKASEYNDDDAVSEVSNRTILKLTSNIDLIDDVEITADVHLNLNAKTLNLNEHTLTFRHGYAGCFSIYGGIINTGESGGGKVTVDLPSAGFVTSSVTYYNNTTTTTEAAVIDVLNIDSKYTAYNALYYVSDSIGSDLNNKLEKATYTEVSDSNYTISQDKFITTKYDCIFNSDTDEVCSFVYKDLDLPMHYLSTDIEITYESSNTAIISNIGKVTLPSTEEDVNLTVSVNHSSWDSAISCVFKLHVVNLNNSTVKNNVAKQLILDLLHDYYKEETLYVNANLSITNYYEFANSVQLPLNAFDNNITYSYSMTDANSNTVSTTSYINNDIYVLEPNDECYHLVININDSIDLTLNMYSLYVGDYETVARLILNKLYGGSITYDSSQPSVTLYKYSDLAANLDSTTLGYATQYGLTSITYALKASSLVETYYNYDNYVLTVKDGQTPVAKASYLTTTFTFGTGVDAVSVDIDVYVNYLAESGDTVAGFLPYYNQYDPMVEEELENSFEMPFSFGTGAPYVVYDVANTFSSSDVTIDEDTVTCYTYTLGRPSSLEIVLYYNGSERYTFTSNALTTELDTYLSNNSLTLPTIAGYGDAKYIFRISAQDATTENVPMLLLYNYKFSTGVDWSTYSYTKDDNTYYTELTTSRFTVCGGLFYNDSSSSTNAVQNNYFFKWIYDNFNPNGSTISVDNINASSFIPKNWLSKDVALDVSQDSTLSSVTNFAGIGNLTSITKVNLSGKTLDASLLTAISSMQSVTYLDLSNCGISDITSICTMDTVKTLDVSNNSIDNFNGLINMKALEEVYVYSNNATTNNPIVGSLGITNFQTYNDLIKDGITVYNQVSNNVPVIYSDSDNYDDYAKIKSIVTQKMLSKNISITSLYSYFDDLDDSSFSLYNTGGTFTWGYQTTDADGNTYTEFTATYFYCNYVFNNYTLTVKFYVDRY